VGGGRNKKGELQPSSFPSLKKGRGCKKLGDSTFVKKKWSCGEKREKKDNNQNENIGGWRHELFSVGKKSDLWFTRRIAPLGVKKETDIRPKGERKYKLGGMGQSPLWE